MEIIEAEGRCQNTMRITILMAAYNGEKYIGAQIESILSQTEKAWRLVIQDDCSTDATYSVVKDYADQYPDKIKAVRRKTNSGGAAANFFSMLSYADSAYLMLADDDDIWLPDKIEKTLAAMRTAEQNADHDTPVLVHTDLKVVDSTLNPIADSLFRRQNLNFSKSSLNHMLSQNIVTGCTVMVNKQLAALAAKGNPPEHAVMHDWWLALIAAAFGIIRFVNTPTVLYRQHTENSVGSKNTSDLFYNVKRFLNTKQAHQTLEAGYKQAEAFYSRFAPLLDEKSAEIIKHYRLIPELSKLQKIRMLNKYDFWMNGFYRKCGQIFFS